MSRLRKFNHKVLRGIGPTLDSDDEVTFLPLDSDEQDELITKFEVRSQSKDNHIIQLLSIAYLLCCGVFLSLFIRVRAKGGEKSVYRRLALFSINSIVSSLMNLRYEVAKDVKFGSITFRLTTKRINTINCTLLLLITWQVIEEVSQRRLQFMFHFPLLLFVVTVITKNGLKTLTMNLKICED